MFLILGARDPNFQKGLMEHNSFIEVNDKLFSVGGQNNLKREFYVQKFVVPADLDIQCN